MAEAKLTPAQRAAVEDRGGSLLVSAAAGSGKTKVLVERLFRYITEEHHNVDDFLMITYTKAAAAELRSKIASELSKRLAEDPENQHLREQLLRVYRADIKTVDAFCTALLRENTHLLEREGDEHCLAPDFRVLDENEAQLLREKVLDRVLESFYGTLTEDGRNLADTLGFGRDDSRMASLILELYEKLQSHAYPKKWMETADEQWMHFESSSENFNDTIFCRTLLHGVACRAEYWRRTLAGTAAQAAGGPLEKGYGTRFSETAETLALLAEAAEGGDWDSVRERAEQVTFRSLSTPKGMKDDPFAVRMKNQWAGCKEEIKRQKALLSLSSAEAMEDLAAVAPSMRALLHLTADFAETYRQEKLRQNAADFSDEEHLALTILVGEDGQPTELGRQVAGRYAEILVDEYQDTNEVQNSIFRAVSREGKNLFTVGDVKQSIYRFRLADPTIFLHKYETFLPASEAKDGEDRKIQLSQNFRSRQEILDAANFVFENILSPEMGEMEYGDDEALHFGADYYPEREDCRTEFHLICARQRGGDNDRPVKRLTAEARFTAAEIRRMLDEKFPVTDGGRLRPCTPDDFAILMRSPGSRLPAYADALAEQNIPCSFQTNEDFFATMEISVMLSLLEIIDNPRQDVPLIAVLRSPLFGFTPDRLAEIRSGTPEGDYCSAVARDNGEDCRAFLEILNDLRAVAQDMSVHRLLWHIYNRLNVLGVFGAMDHGTQRKENLIVLTEHAEKFESSGYCGVFAFVTQLRRLIETGRAPQTRGAAISSGVRLMSIHKSKGLEFPIVFLTDLDHAFSRQDFDSPVLVHPELGLGPVRMELERRIKYPTMARLAIQETLQRENKSEEQRILYVAMTRAKEKLILVDSVYHAESKFAKLAASASCPVLPEAVAAGKSLGDWILLPLLCRPEAESLRQLAGSETENLYTGSTSAWEITIHDAEEFREVPERADAEGTGEISDGSFDPSLLEFQYPYEKETVMPEKLTATQLKGREADEEIAEQAPHHPALRPLSQPKFRQQHGLTPEEAGTATHLMLQYLNFDDEDVAGQVEKLRARHLLTPEQADAVLISSLEKFLHSELAEKIRASRRVLREYRFTLLVSARDYDPAAASEDQILLQGIADCCFETADGTLTVVDFKTDRVGKTQIFERAEHYRPQLEAYSMALSRILEKPVSHRILYFLHADQQVELQKKEEN